MKFTTRDIAENKKLRNFIRTRVLTDKTILVDNYLLNVYTTKQVIEQLEERIAKYSTPSCHTRFIEGWNGLITYLKEMERVHQSNTDN